MKRSTLAAVLAACLAASVSYAATKSKAPAAKAAPAKSAAAPAPAPAETLDGGSYTAQVKRIVCSGCAALIEDAMKGVPGVESASVAADSGALTFGVKKGAAVKMSDIRKALKDAEGMMGMGASYDLSGLKKNG